MSGDVWDDVYLSSLTETQLETEIENERGIARAAGHGRSAPHIWAARRLEQRLEELRAATPGQEPKA